MSKFLCMWDCDGIEAVINIDPYEHEAEENLIRMMQTGRPVGSKFGTMIRNMMIRARFNGHRFYEIYAVETESELSERDMFELFTGNPQGMADLVRKNGVKVFSDRRESKPAII